MQQTQKYKLNLIETSDTFSPQALNENTQKLETVLSTAIEEHQAETDARLTVLEGHKVYFGHFVGGGKAFHVPLPFAPKAVITSSSNGLGYTIISTNAPNGQHPQIRLLEDGFEATSLSYQAFIAFC